MTVRPHDTNAVAPERFTSLTDGAKTRAIEGALADLAGDQLLLELALEDTRRGIVESERTEDHVTLVLTREQHDTLWHAADRVRRSVHDLTALLNAAHGLEVRA